MAAYGKSRFAIVLTIIASAHLNACKSRSSLTDSNSRLENLPLPNIEHSNRSESDLELNPLYVQAKSDAQWAKDFQSSALIGRLTHTRTKSKIATGTTLYEREAMQKILDSLVRSQHEGHHSPESSFRFNKCIRRPAPAILDGLRQKFSAPEKSEHTSISGSYESLWNDLLDRESTTKDSCLQALLGKSRLYFQFILMPERTESRLSKSEPPRLRQAIVISARAYDEAAVLFANAPLPEGMTLLLLRSDTLPNRAEALILPSHLRFKPTEAEDSHRALGGSEEPLRIARKDWLIDRLLKTQPESLADLSARFAALQHWGENQLASFEQPLERDYSNLEKSIITEAPELTQSLLNAFAGKSLNFGQNSQRDLESMDISRVGVCSPSDLDLGPNVFLDYKNANSLSKNERELFLDRERACQGSDLLLAMTLATKNGKSLDLLDLALQNVFMSSLALLLHGDFEQRPRSAVYPALKDTSSAFASEFRQVFQDSMVGIMHSRLQAQRSLRNASLQMKALINSQIDPKAIQADNHEASPTATFFTEIHGNLDSDSCPAFSNDFLRKETQLDSWSRCFASLRKTFEGTVQVSGVAEWLTLWSHLYLSQNTTHEAKPSLAKASIADRPESFMRSALELKAALMSSSGSLIMRSPKFAPWNQENTTTEALIQLSQNMLSDVEHCAKAFQIGSEAKKMCGVHDSSCEAMCSRSAHHKIRHEFWPADFLLCLERPDITKPEWSCTVEFDGSSDDGRKLSKLLDQTKIPKLPLKNLKEKRKRLSSAP